MSAPQTNIEKQKARHIGPLVGMAAAVIFALALLFGLFTWIAAEGQTPETPDVVIDGRTGEPTPTE